jgi:hypothetical protein
MPTKPKKSIEGRAASRDLRIGLNLLGENGRTLLREYVKIKILQAASKEGKISQ